MDVGWSQRGKVRVALQAQPCCDDKLVFRPITVHLGAQEAVQQA